MIIKRLIHRPFDNEFRFVHACRSRQPGYFSPSMGLMSKRYSRKAFHLLQNRKFFLKPGTVSRNLVFFLVIRRSYFIG